MERLLRRPNEIMEIKTEKFTGGGGGYELLKFKDCDIFYVYPLCPGRSRVHYKIVIRKEKNASRVPYCLQHKFQLCSPRAESKIKTWGQTDYEIVQKARMRVQKERETKRQANVWLQGGPHC